MVSFCSEIITAVLPFFSLQIMTVYGGWKVVGGDLNLKLVLKKMCF